MNNSRRSSIHDHPRDEVLAAMRQVLDFLEATPEVDLPENMGELWIRTLVRKNRGELKEKREVAEWFRRQVIALNGEKVLPDSDHFSVIRDFGAGVRIMISTGIGEVCEKTVEVKTVSRIEEYKETTWHCPPELSVLGFEVNEEYLREREQDYAKDFRYLGLEQYVV